MTLISRILPFATRHSLNCFNVHRLKPTNLAKLDTATYALQRSLFSTSFYNSQKKQYKFDPKFFQTRSDSNTKNLVWYTLSGLMIMGGMSYAAVPLFKIFCESQGYDANTDFRDMNIELLVDRLRAMKKVEDRSLVIKFVACTSADLKWDFVPSQTEITVAPGETALAFFKAKNNTNRPIIGIGTVNH